MRISFPSFCKTVVLLSLFGVAIPFEAFPRSEYWEQRVTLFNLLPVEEGDIVFLGNSITDGGEFSEFFPGLPVRNRGISSDVISGVEERLYQITDGKPSKVFLLIGINDISHGKTASEIFRDYKRLAGIIREQSPETELYLQSVMPINNDFGRYKNLKGKEVVLTELNGMLKALANEIGADYVDLWPALADPKSGKLKRSYTNDGLHLLGSGYKAWMEAIRPLVETEPKKK